MADRDGGAAICECDDRPEECGARATRASQAGSDDELPVLAMNRILGHVLSQACLVNAGRRRGAYSQFSSRAFGRLPPWLNFGRPAAEKAEKSGSRWRELPEGLNDD